MQRKHIYVDEVILWIIKNITGNLLNLLNRSIPSALTMFAEQTRQTLNMSFRVLLFILRPFWFPRPIQQIAARQAARCGEQLLTTNRLALPPLCLMHYVSIPLPYTFVYRLIHIHWTSAKLCSQCDDVECLCFLNSQSWHQRIYVCIVFRMRCQCIDGGWRSGWVGSGGDINSPRSVSWECEYN